MLEKPVFAGVFKCSASNTFERDDVAEKTKRGQMTPFTRDDIQLIRGVLRAKGELRDLAILNCGVDTMLRAGDLVRLKVSDVTNHLGQVTERCRIIQDKTGEAVHLTLTPATREAMAALIKDYGKWIDDYLFTADREPHGQHLSEVSLRKIVKGWAALCCKDPRRYSGHSLRRTKASFLYRETGNIEAVRRLLGHASLKHTIEYLGVSDNDASELALKFAM